MDIGGGHHVPRSLRRCVLKEGGNEDTFHVLSKNTSKSGVRHCIDAKAKTAELTAVNFDAFTANAYKEVKQQCGHLPCSVDALFFGGTGTFAVEFKTGDCNATQLVRKIYDTVMCLYEKAGRSFDVCWARKDLTVVVVCSKQEYQSECALLTGKQKKDARVIRRAITYQRKPDLHEGRRVFFGLDKLSGIIVSAVYTLSPADFDEFAERQGWLTGAVSRCNKNFRASARLSTINSKQKEKRTK